MQTTDAQDEIYDTVDADDNVIGTALRSEVHGDKSLIHRSVGVLVFRGHQVFLQQRSMTKDHNPGCWTFSCSGHLDAGESYEAAVVRELKEELGLVAKPPPVFLAKEFLDLPNETEIMTIYRYDTEDPITVNEVEIMDGKFFTIDDVFFEKVFPTMEFSPAFVQVYEKLLR